MSPTDFQCGAKAIHRSAWEETAPYLDEAGFGWDVELISIVDALGFSLCEVPIEWEDAPESTVSSVGDDRRTGEGPAHRMAEAARIEPSSGPRRHSPTAVVPGE
ncbi:MAG: hypothetical protein U5K37_02095 [Natrialbaceae archaeon]|nr:hypothetical protein [Natrialbaceae archaeon]